MKKNIAAFVIAASLFSACSSENEKTNEQYSDLDVAEKTAQPISTLEVGDAAPEFSMKNEEGVELSLGSLKGSVVVIDFWATWCPPCVRSIPHIQSLWKEYKNNGVEFLGVSLDKDLDVWKKYIKDREMAWKHVADGKYWDNSAARLYNVESIPSVWVLNREGKIVGKNLYADDVKDAIEKALKQ